LQKKRHHEKKSIQKPTREGFARSMRSFFFFPSHRIQRAAFFLKGIQRAHLLFAANLLVSIPFLYFKRYEQKIRVVIFSFVSFKIYKKHRLYLFSDNQGKEKKRLHAPLLLYSYGVSGVSNLRNIKSQEYRVSGISGASNKGNKRETKASFFIRYFLLYYLVFCVNKTSLLTR